VPARKGALRLVLFGAPGAGKGTQAAEIRRRAGLPHISTGEMLRQAVQDGSPLGRSVRGIVERGDLVPDALVGAVMEERLSRPDAREGFLLDGFPRTAAQADFLDRLLAARGQALDGVIQLEVPETEILGRLTGRRVCAACGATYHVRFGPPRAEGVCDACGGCLVQRPDDRAEAIEERLRAYRRQTRPLLERYEAKGLLRRVDGRGTPDEVYGRIAAAVAGLAG
jgi:adenylate kinase